MTSFMMLARRCEERPQWHPACALLAISVRKSRSSDWGSGASSKDYPGYDKMIEVLSKEDVHTQREKSAAFIGSPEECCDMISDFHTQIGGFDIASLQVNTKMMPVEMARASMELFGREVIPKFLKT